AFFKVRAQRHSLPKTWSSPQPPAPPVSGELILVTAAAKQLSAGQAAKGQPEFPEALVQDLPSLRSHYSFCTASAVQEGRMQRGSLIRKNRKQGPDVWQFRWSEKGPEGRRIYRKRVIGTLEQYPSEDAALRAVVGLVSEINSSDRRCDYMTTSIGDPPVF